MMIEPGIFLPPVDHSNDERRFNWFDAAAWSLRSNRIYAPNCFQEPLDFLNFIWGHFKYWLPEELPDGLDGWFYVVNLDSDDNKTFKLGFSGNIDKRLKTYRTIAPTAGLVHWWPTKQSWEPAALDCVIRNVFNCRQIGDSEVVKCESLWDIIFRLNDFFSVLGSVEPDLFCKTIVQEAA